MFEVITVVAIVLVVSFGFYLIVKNPDVNKKVNNWLDNKKPIYTEQVKREGVIYDKNEPLDRNTYIQMQDYADRKQDSRFDELLTSVDKILFWTRIVGFYFLVKIVIVVIRIIIAVLAGSAMIDALTSTL